MSWGGIRRRQWQYLVAFDTDWRDFFADRERANYRRRRGALFCSRLSKADDDDDDGDDNDGVETDFVGGELLSRRRRVRRLFFVSRQMEDKWYD